MIASLFLMMFGVAWSAAVRYFDVNLGALLRIVCKLGGLMDVRDSCKDNAAERCS
jgi:hypothetical protein